MTDEEYEKWIKDFDKTMLEGDELEAKTTELGDGVSATVYQRKDADPKITFGKGPADAYKVGIFSASGYEKVDFDSLPEEVQQDLNNEREQGQRKQASCGVALAGNDDILGAIIDLCVHDLKRNNFTFRHDHKYHSNCFPYVTLERYEETVAPVKPKRIHKRIDTFLVTLSSHEAIAGFELSAEEAIFLSREHRKKYPKRLIAPKSWPRQEVPAILDGIFRKVQEAIKALEHSYHMKQRADEGPPPTSH